MTSGHHISLDLGRSRGEARTTSRVPRCSTTWTVVPVGDGVPSTVSARHSSRWTRTRPSSCGRRGCLEHGAVLADQPLRADAVGRARRGRGGGPAGAGGEGGDGDADEGQPLAGEADVEEGEDGGDGGADREGQRGRTTRRWPSRRRRRPPLPPARSTARSPDRPSVSAHPPAPGTGCPSGIGTVPRRFGSRARPVALSPHGRSRRSPPSALRPRPSRRRVVEGRGHRRAAQRRRRALRARVLHRRRGRRHPQPGDGHRGGAGRPSATCAARSWPRPRRSSATPRSCGSATATRACPVSPENARPDCFANAPFDEAVGRLVAIIRRERPHVVLTYPDIQDGYAHPDHLRVHDITIAAVREAADAGAASRGPARRGTSRSSTTRCGRGPGSRPCTTSCSRSVSSRPSRPRGSGGRRRTSGSPPGSTRPRSTSARRAALLAHATQIDPASPFWFALPDDVAATVHPWEEYTLARSSVPVELPETDLFAGLREHAYES